MPRNKKNDAPGDAGSPRRKKSAPGAPSALPSKSAILDFLAEVNGDATRRDIARAFNIKGDARTELRSLLKEMNEEGLLNKTGPKRVQTPDALPPVLPLDIISANDDGDLLCIPSKWRSETTPPTIRLPARDAARQKPALGEGDRILARVRLAGDDGYEASVIKAIGRGAQRFLAVFRARKFGGIAEPVEKRVRQKFTIDREDTKGAQDGDLVWAEAAPRRGSSSTKARIQSIAGNIDDRNAFSLMALANHNVPMDMPPAAEKEAEKAKAPTLSARDDLRATPLLTIDPADAKDHDDAVWAAPDDDPNNEGGFQVIVAIADVSWFVREGTALDREARRRGNSVYLPDRVVPMLPERLSNELCSLRVGEDRPCLAVKMIIDANGHKKSHRFMRALMRSASKLSYEEAQALIENPTDNEIGQTIRHLKNAFDARWRERTNRAPLDLDLPERRVVLNKEGEVLGVTRKDRFDAHRVIEEFMILANIAAAETLEQKKTEQMYRVHEAPDDEKLAATRDYLSSLDYSLIKGGAVRPRHFNQLLKLAESRDQKELISQIVLRSQMQAYYGVENFGHFGLNLAKYSHFTSPIRRYADLTIHRALVKACNLGEGGQSQAEAKELHEIAEFISDTERRAMAAEREATDRYLASFLEERVGDEFEGRIRGVTRFGLFVALEETGADGFVPMRAVGFERFRFDEARHALIGETTGGVYFLGQAVTVRLAEAAPVTGGLRFDLLSDPAPGDKQSRRDKTRKTEYASRSKKPSSRNKATRKAPAGKSTEKQNSKKQPPKNAKPKKVGPAKKIATAAASKPKSKRGKSNAKSRQS